MELGMEVGLGPGHIVLDGDPAPPEKRHSPTQFLAHVYCGQTDGWIKMPLGTKVNLDPGDVVLDGVAAPPNRGTVCQLSALVYCGHGSPSQLLLSSCRFVSFVSEIKSNLLP